MAHAINHPHKFRGIELRTDVLMHLWISPDGECTDRVAKAVGLSRFGLARHLRQLEEAGHIIWQRGTGRNARGFVQLAVSA